MIIKIGIILLILNKYYRVKNILKEGELYYVFEKKINSNDNNCFIK